MSFSIISLIPACQNRMYTENQDSENLLRKPEIVALTTDIALATLALLAAVLVLLQVHGFLQLGSLTSIGITIGARGAYSLLTLASGIFLLNSLAFITKQSLSIYSLRTRQRELESERQAFLVQNTIWEEETRSLETQLTQAREIQTQLQTQSLVNQEQPTTHSEEMNRLHAQIRQLESRNNEITQSLERYRNLATTREEESTRLQSHVRHLESVQSTSQGTNPEPSNNYHVLENENRQLHDRIEQLEAEFPALLRQTPTLSPTRQTSIEESPNSETSENNAASVENDSEASQSALYSNEWCEPSQGDFVPLLKREFIDFIKRQTLREQHRYISKLINCLKNLFNWKDDDLGKEFVDNLLSVVPKNYVDYIHLASGNEKEIRVKEVYQQLEKLYLHSFPAWKSGKYKIYQENRVANALKFVLKEENDEVEIDIVLFKHEFLNQTPPTVLSRICDEMFSFENNAAMIDFFSSTPSDLALLKWEIQREIQNNRYSQPLVEYKIIELERKSYIFQRNLSLLFKNETIRNLYLTQN